mgnify:CR=1 FL=1
MIIQCTECGKEFSDKVNACPNCGCSIDEMDYSSFCNINRKMYNLIDIVNILPKIGTEDTDIHPYYIVGMIRDRTPLDPQSSEQLAKIIIETKQIPREFNGTIEVKVAEQINIPHCPVCNSTEIEKISATSKVAGAVAFGLFSKTARSQFKCKSCGYKF